MTPSAELANLVRIGTLRAEPVAIAEIAGLVSSGEARVRDAGNPDLQRYYLDMIHVTERKGSPQTLVCRKTLHTFERRCEQRTKDIAALDRLLAMVDAGVEAFAAPCERIAAASARAPQQFSPR